MNWLRPLIVFTIALGSMAYADATQWTPLKSASDLDYAVDSDSIATDSDGYIEYTAKTTWKAPSMMPGASRPVAVSISRYQIDCAGKQWRTLDTHYLAADGTPAGVLRSADATWAAVSPGTVVDAMFRKVC
ncbi:surface-adhesin E family protein [Trinickia acidisoli]|uniref:surface-adhesin E family protein n=1 Tax=Trinickia acidisoli TaxID=2767482 RepID=UPI001A8F362B|nr:surface-adhesin E family protein [Trinickia acidisoli]